MRIKVEDQDRGWICSAYDNAVGWHPRMANRYAHRIGVNVDRGLGMEGVQGWVLVVPGNSRKSSCKKTLAGLPMIVISSGHAAF